MTEQQFNLFDDSDSGSMNEDSAPYQRHSDTSRAAAEEIESSRDNLRAKVFRYLQSLPYGATDEEMQEALGMNPSTQRPRRIELVDRGLVVNSGIKRLTRSNCKAAVWKIA